MNKHERENKIYGYMGRTKCVWCHRPKSMHIPSGFPTHLLCPIAYCKLDGDKIGF